MHRSFFTFDSVEQFLRERDRQAALRTAPGDGKCVHWLVDDDERCYVTVEQLDDCRPHC